MKITSKIHVTYWKSYDEKKKAWDVYMGPFILYVKRGL